MTVVVEEDPELLDPAWQLPLYLDQARRIHVDLFVDHLRRAQLALDEIEEEPDCPYYDETNAKLALRHLRFGLAHNHPPVAGVALREVRRDTLLELFDDCQERGRELLRGWGEPHMDVAQLGRKFRFGVVMVEILCSIVEQTDLAANPTQGVVDTISCKLDYVSSVAGNGEMRERDDDVSMGVRLANIELEELVIPAILRLSHILALFERHRATSAAPRIREV